MFYKFPANGYTILEVMIVLAITGSMVAMASISFGGRQQQIRFTQSVRELDAKLRDYMNDVSTGYYETSGKISCTINGSNLPNIDYDDAGARGTSDACLYSGKVMHVNNADTSAINVYDVATKRYATDEGTPSDLNEAAPTMVAELPSAINLQSGLKITKVGIDGSPSDDIGAFAILTDANKTSQVGGTTDVESTTVYALMDSNRTENANGIARKLRAGTSNGNTKKATVVICLTDFEDKRKASITFGGNESGTKVDFDTYNVGVCG